MFIQCRMFVLVNATYFYTVLAAYQRSKKMGLQSFCIRILILIPVCTILPKK